MTGRASSTAICLLGLGLCAGCTVTSAGLGREQAIYRAGTNVVAVLDRYVVPAVPGPWQPLATGVLALATAALGAWNVHQQGQLRALRNGPGLNSARPPVNVTGGNPP